jgi:hypothetical protein
MIPWTETAAKIWEDFCHRTRENLRDSGADADEVVDDLRRHVEEEIRASKLSMVTEEDMRRILARVGEPPAAESARQPGKKGVLFWLFLVVSLLFGVLLPMGTILIEMFTGASAGVLFDPIPTWFQVLAVTMVPLTNLWLWLVLFSGKSRWPKFLGWLSGAAAGIAVFYTILYLPFTSFAAMAVVYFGAGFIPLSPVLSLVCVLLLRKMAARVYGGATFGRFGPAFGIALLALALAQLPAFLTYNGLARAVSDDPATRHGGVNTLRRFGDGEMLLRFCYGMNNFREADFDVVRRLGSGNTRISNDQAREIYFRVAGRPFNAVPPPSFYTRAGRWNALDDEFSWDDAVGGEAVAGHVKGLSLLSSRMDAVAEPEAAVVYCEWTMEFKNISRQQREARAQIALPPGGVVSRLTLWVNGEEREAAFGGRSQVRQAYQQVAVAQRRDPVLVTTCGPDRVMMQCFPVPPNGGTMKIRLGITAPLALESPERGDFEWPEFLERNFKLPPDFKHAVWMESPMKITPVNSALVISQPAQTFSAHGNLADNALGGVMVERPAETRAAWTPVLATGQIIRQRIQESTQPAASRIVLVIDGSAGMKQWTESLAEVVGQIPAGTELAVITADDGASTPTPPARADAQMISNIASRLKHFHFSGGCDNLPALEQGWDLAAGSDHGAVIWIHDAQPVLLSPVDSLRQRMEHGGKTVSIFDVQLRPGPNRIAEQMDGLRSFKSVPRPGGVPVVGLKNQFAVLEGKNHPLEFARDCVTNSTAEGPQVGRHIERLWAKDEAARLASARRADEASKLASGQQLVTPFSGAVVLETKQQYTQNNLTPAAATSVPVVPEPSTWALLIMGIAMICWRVSRRLPA